MSGNINDQPGGRIMWPESGRLTLGEFEQQAGVTIGEKFVWSDSADPQSSALTSLLNAARDAAALFRLYEAHHRSRVDKTLNHGSTDPAEEKAERNRAMAERLEEVIRKFDRQIEEEENDGA